MARTQKSTALYSTPFSKAYWRDAAAEMKSVKTLTVTALLVALRIVLKPFAIYIAPQLGIQTAMLATVLGAMIFGPVVAIPAAVISDTIGFILFPTGEYFLPFVLTEIASTMIYALLLYRTKVTPIRVMLSRFFICLFVNIILQQFIMAWQAAYMGTPEKAWAQIEGILSVMRIFKNLCFFPVETVVLTVFLKFLIPITRKAGLTYGSDSDMRFDKKFVITLVCLMLVGTVASGGYLKYRYDRTSRTADFSTEERVDAQKEMTKLVLERTDDWDDQTVVCIIDSAFRPLFADETDYTVSVYILDAEAFAAGQAADEKYTLETLWAYSKSGPKNDAYGSLVKVATVTMEKNEKTGEILAFDCVFLSEAAT